MKSLTQSTEKQILYQQSPDWLPQGNNSSNPAPEIVLTKDNATVLTWLVSKGISNAMWGLSQMVGHEIRVTSLDLKWLPVKDSASLLGGTEATNIGIHLKIEGDATGHLLLMYDPRTAFQLVDIQLGLPPGSTQKIDEIERSVLGEMGNITGSFFLNALADSTNLVLMPSPPTVLVDMMKVILNIPMTFIIEKQDDALVVKATFSSNNQQIDGTFIVLPTIDFMKALLGHSRNMVYV